MIKNISLSKFKKTRNDRFSFVKSKVHEYIHNNDVEDFGSLIDESKINNTENTIIVDKHDHYNHKLITIKNNKSDNKKSISINQTKNFKLNNKTSNLSNIKEKRKKFNNVEFFDSVNSNDKMNRIES